MTEALKSVPVDRLHESPLNVRKTFDGKAMAELVQSVKDHGRILHPILVRPMVVAGSARAEGSYEIVCGHRRVRAAKAAGLETVPAIVRELSDREAVETSLVELAQGAPVHPLEQAESMRVLVDQHGITTDDLAAKLSKSRRWVQVQLQLCKLSKAAKTAFLDGTLSASVASRVARAPEQLHAAILKRFHESVKYDKASDGQITDKLAAEILEREFMLRLDDAPWDKADPSLVAEAGACAGCPKRTGAQPELFSDVKTDVCTEPSCFKAKLAAHQGKVLTDAVARGESVLSEADAKKVFPQNPQLPLIGYVSLDAICYEDPKHRTYRKLLGEHADHVLALNPHDGKLYELLSSKDAKKALKDAGHDFTKVTAESAVPRVKKTPEEEQRQSLGEKLLEAARIELVKRAAKQQAGTDFLRTVAAFLDEGGFEGLQAIADERGFSEPNWFAEASQDDLRAYIFDCAVDSIAFVDSDGGLNEGFKALCRDYGVPLTDFEAKLKANALFDKPTKKGAA